MHNIMVVDDERSIRVTVKTFLELEGHRVEVAEDAESAMAILRRTPMDVVFTDIILPKESGVDLLRKIRDISPATQVIMMTGEPTLETASESLRLGAMDYLQKPVNRTEILKVARNAVHVKSLIDDKLRLEEENRHHMDHLKQLVEKRTRELAASEAALRRRADELSVLNRLARKVNETKTVSKAIQHGLQEIVHTLAPDFAVIFLCDGENLLLKGTYPESTQTGWQPQDTPQIGECFCGMAVQQATAIYSPDIHTDPRRTLLTCEQAGFRSFAALPLLSDSQPIGVLGIASSQPRDFQAQAGIIEALANEMSIGLKKNLLYEQVQQHADALKQSLLRIEEGEAERLHLQQHLQRAQKMEAIGTLASGIAHDFNNILGAVIGYTELALLDTAPEAPSRKKLDMVLTASDRAKDLIKQILAFSRQSDEELKPIRISHVIEEVLKFMRASLPATIEIHQSTFAEMDNILADPVQIQQVLMNLCTNALHAMREHGGRLDVNLSPAMVESRNPIPHPDLKFGKYAKVTVKDTGHGISPAAMEKIFEPYFTTKGKGVGTGLGLAVVHGIVRKHGGAITVRSEPGTGTEFDLYFPTIPAGKLPEIIAPEKLATGHEHILLVDDEQYLVDICRQMVEFLGYTVETRTSSMDALALFREQSDRFDLVITDLTMPGMTGDKLAAEILRIQPEIPIVLCSGYGEQLLEDKARAIGIKDFVRKPILLSRLARSIREALH